MGSKKLLAFALLSLLPFVLIVAGSESAMEGNQTFPVYGSGLIEVRIYSDYFCPPCRWMEPDVEPLLKDLLRKNTIRLLLVDAPFNPLTPLFARNFLYAIKVNNEPEHAFRVRKILQNAAAGKDITSQERMEALLEEKKIAFSLWDPKPTFDRYNALLKEDKISATPACVIIKNGRKRIFVGMDDILEALKALP